METPRIYVASLSDYNAGILHGTWIDAGQDIDSIREEIKAMLAESRNQPAEEYAIHDYEGFYGIKINEYSGIDEIVAIAELIEEHGEAGALVYADFGDIDAAHKAMEEDYQGEFDSLADYAEEFTRDCYTIPDFLEFYIDWEKMGRDMDINDLNTYEGENGKIHVFWNR